MSGPLDPPHDRLSLTKEERRAIAAIEEALRHDEGELAIAGGDPLGTPGWRYRVFSACFRLVRLGPWLVPLGLVLLIWALPVSIVISAVGALITALGLAACARHPRLRHPMAWLRLPPDH